MGLFDSFRNLFGGDEGEAAEGEDGAAAADEGAAGGGEKGAAKSEAPESPADHEAVAEELGEEFRPHAEDFAADWPDHDFDFSADSLARLDAFVDDRWEKSRFADAVFNGDDDTSREFTGIVVQTGSYFGETIVRSSDAEWVDDEDFGAAVRVYGEDEDAVVNVFHIAAGCLREPANFTDTYERATADS